MHQRRTLGRSRRPARLALVPHLALVPLVIGALGLPAAAQLRSPGRPATEASPLPGLPTIDLPVPDLAAYRAEDERNGNWPLRYGALIPVSIGLESGGRMDVAADGSLVWRARLRSAGAFSIGLEFDRFELPEGARLFVYDPAREKVLGAYTALNNKANGEFQVEPLPGDTAIVEYVQPPGASAPARLRIGTVIHDYRDVLGTVAGEEGGGGGGACLIDVNCPQASGFQDEKRSVARIFSGGVLCSGALLNNTAEDERQFFLTANHCGGMNNAVFVFNYELSGCGSGGASLSDSVQGSTLLSTSSVEDYRLIEIDENIPQGFGVYYAGFKTTSGAPASSVSIHHPSGGPKKFSRDFSSPSKFNFPFWAATWDEGLVEGGSSGGPLFNGQGYVMGPACCVDNFTCGAQTTFYGRMDLYWSDISPWLDPLGLNPSLFAGLDDSPPPPGVLSITSVSPTTVNAVTVDGPPVVDVFGDEFFTVTGITVDGIQLENFPPDYSILNDTHIQIINWPQVTQVGSVDVVLTSATDQVTTQVAVTANAPPALNLKGSQSEGGFLFSATGLDMTLGSKAGDVHFLAFSGSSNPSVLPGFVSWGLGNNFFALYSLGSYAMPAEAYVNVQVPVGGGLGGVIVYVQSAVLVTGNPVFPLTMSNVQSGQFLF